ncbi:hypothetical protein IFM89_015582 [Coptis chinensis]|uniref:Plastocyanin-like domain-containing protein n=1 Tax=Coptis chinensis TaxID=261450 RepID=A0A835I489_9MAGN|nr:hypothetical protein IFM89_015582 [Coptis chinensis]
MEEKNIEEDGLGIENFVDAYMGHGIETGDIEPPFVPEPDLGKRGENDIDEIIDLEGDVLVEIFGKDNKGRTFVFVGSQISRNKLNIFALVLDLDETLVCAYETSSLPVILRSQATEPGKNWTYVFQTKDQIGSFFYFPTLNFQKATGGFGPLKVNNRNVILVPFNKPEAEFDLLIGDWYSYDYKHHHNQINFLSDVLVMLAYLSQPDQRVLNFKMEQEVYTKEEIDWSYIEYL